MLKEQVEALIQENMILKRAVSIQHERQKEYEDRSQELHHLKQLVSQYQEQLRTLEVRPMKHKLTYYLSCIAWFFASPSCLNFKLRMFLYFFRLLGGLWHWCLILCCTTRWTIMHWQCTWNKQSIATLSRAVSILMFSKNSWNIDLAVVDRIYKVGIEALLEE